MKKFTATKTESLKSFTDSTYPQGSFYFSRLLKARDIRVNGERTGKDVTLSPGDEVTYYTTAEQEARRAFSVLYRDSDILVADKDSGVNSEAVFFTLSQEEEGLCFIHRLDRNTQGLIAFARNAGAERALLSAFRERRARKLYQAVCVGRPPRDQGVLTAYLKKDAGRSLVSVSDRPDGGERIVTEYRVVRLRPDGLSDVEIVLHSGKTHQIRAHMAHIGCPVLGDTKYGDSAANARFSRTRQCLVAKELTLDTQGKLPKTDKRTFVSEFSLW